MKTEFDKIKEFPVTIFGELEQINPAYSKGRVRIFYKGINRNGTYISEEFAEQLISTLHYTPVKGIYDEEAEDFTDHGTARNQGRAYGFVPKDNNFAWETRLDDDGVEREYACVDVIIWTALYPEARDIVGKAQSMELFEKTILGEYIFHEGRRVFKFTAGSFLGFQVLGDEVEPCFEGSAFFSKDAQILGEILDYIKNFESKDSNSQNRNIEGGNAKMALKINFKLSDATKHDMIWSLLNPNCNEENNYSVDYAVCDVYDDYAICFNYGTGGFERVQYSKDDSTDTVTVGDKVECFIVDVTKEEKIALEALHAIKGSFEKVDEEFTSLETTNKELSEKVEGFDTKVEEFEAQISTLTTDKEAAEIALNTANEKVGALEGELSTLTEYKVEVEKKEKEAVIAQYTEQLDKEVIDEYTEKLGEYTALELDKELSYKLVKSNPNLFTQQPGLIPSDDDPTKGGVESLLTSYVHNKKNTEEN